MSIEWFQGCQTKEDVTVRYRELAKQCHPDRGGSTEAMQQLNDARAAALSSLPIEDDQPGDWQDWSPYANYVVVVQRPAYNVTVTVA